MTNRTRRALYRVRNHARHLHEATDALRPVDWRTMPLTLRLAVRGAGRIAGTVSERLTRMLEDEPTAVEGLAAAIKADLTPGVPLVVATDGDEG